MMQRMAKYIDVIDENYDVSFEETMAIFEDIWNGISTKEKISNYTFDNTKLFQQNFEKLELINRQLSRKLNLPKTSGNLRFANEDLGCHIPSYAPPSSKQLYAFELYCRHQKYNTSAEDYRNPPRMPMVPLAKTNTNLSNYVHKLYIYKQHVKEQIKVDEYKKLTNQFPMTTIYLKHNYDAQLSKKIARIMSTKSGRNITI